MPSRYSIPAEMADAVLLVETGWSPEELDKMSEVRLAKFLLAKNVKDIATYGGELQV